MLEQNGSQSGGGGCRKLFKGPDYLGVRAWGKIVVLVGAIISSENMLIHFLYTSHERNDSMSFSKVIKSLIGFSQKL